MIDPLINHCRCGHQFRITKWQHLKMLLFGDLMIICPKCHRRMTYRLVYHTARVGMEEMNKELWRKG